MVLPFSNQEGKAAAEGSGLIRTALSIHPDWDIPQEDRYVYAFRNTECPPLEPNQLSLADIDGVAVGKGDGQYYILTAFIRQSLDKPIRLQKTAILLLGPDQERLARKVFDLSEAGEIPVRSSRPWRFVFEKKDFFPGAAMPKHGWSLAFEIKPKNRLDLDPKWKQSLADTSVRWLEQVVAGAAPLKPGEVNFMGLSAKPQEDGGLAVTLLIRNGSGKDIKLEQLPLAVEDAAGDTIARGHFTLEQLEVKANTSKPWTFVFPKGLVLKENPDLSRWRAYPPQK